MKLQSTCPACDKPITIWRVMAAATPWHLKCGACGMRLRAIGLTGPALAVAALVGAPLGYFAGHMIAAGQTRPALVIAITGIAVAELLISLVLVNSAKLEPKA